METRITVASSATGANPGSRDWSVTFEDKAGSLTPREENYADARDFGIYGDNLDYTTQLQTAIDALDAMYDPGAPQGMRTLVLPEGAIRVNSVIDWKRVGLTSRSKIPNAGCRIYWDGASGGTVLAAHAALNLSFGLLEGINFRNGVNEPGTVIDLTGASGAVDVMFRLREIHINQCLSHAIKIPGWVNLHWEHLRIDHVGNGYAILATPGGSQNLSSFVIDGFTYDHNRTSNPGHGFMCIDNSGGATNIGTVALKNARIEVNQPWAPLGPLGSGGSTRAVFTERLANVSATVRSVRWSLADITYADSSGMTDDSVLFRDTSDLVSDASPSLNYSNLHTGSASKVFGGSVGPRMSAFPAGALTGIGAINASPSNAMAIGFGGSATLSTPNVSPEGSTVAPRGSIALAQTMSIASTGYIKELSDTTNAGWSRIETAYQQAIAYSTSITPGHNKGNRVIVGTLAGNLTVNAMSASSVYVPGHRARFYFTSDDSARTITWNATWKGATLTTASAANQRAIVEFEYDGTNWVQTMSTGWYS